MRWFLLMLLLIILLGGCSAPASLSHHKVSYQVTAEHENDSIQHYMEQQPLSFSIQFKGDSLYAQYRYGMTQLHHLALGPDTAILAASFESIGYKSFLDGEDIERYLQLRSPYTVKTQPGKTTIDSIQCKRALIVYPDGNSTDLFFSEKWRPSNPNYDYSFREIKGLPLKFSVIEEDITYHFRLIDMQSTTDTITPPSLGGYETVETELLLNKGLTW